MAKTSVPAAQYTTDHVYIHWPAGLPLPPELEAPGGEGTKTIDLPDGRKLLKRMLLDVPGMRVLLITARARKISGADVLTPEEARALLPIAAEVQD